MLSFIRSEPEIGPRGNEIIFESVVILVLDIAWPQQERYSTREVTGCARKRGSKKVRKLVTRPGFSNHCSPPMEKKEGKKKGEKKKKKNLFSARFPVDVAKF